MFLMGRDDGWGVWMDGSSFTKTKILLVQYIIIGIQLIYPMYINNIVSV